LGGGSGDLIRKTRRFSDLVAYAGPGADGQGKAQSESILDALKKVDLADLGGEKLGLWTRRDFEGKYRFKGSWTIQTLVTDVWTAVRQRYSRHLPKRKSVVS